MARAEVEIPFCVSGEGFARDLGFVAEASGLTEGEVLSRFCAGVYVVEMMGFAPGFAYLGGLDASLRAPRLNAPRPRVPAGSVAIAGGRAGVYPLETPGGWRILGRTPRVMFDARRTPPALLSPGVTVRFRLVDRAEFDRLRAIEDAEASARSGAGDTPLGPAWALVRSSGQQTTMQDLGRFGHEPIGVSPSGAADGLSHSLGQRLVGNQGVAASLEMTLVGVQLEILEPVIVALTGAPAAATIEQRSGRLVELPMWRAVSLSPGEVLRMHAIGGEAEPRGLRSYLSVRGGVDGPVILGSRSTHVSTGVGPPPVRTVDTLHLARDHAEVMPPRVEADAVALCRGTIARRTVRVCAGPHAGRDSLAALHGRSFRVDPRTDRVGVRLDGEPMPGGEASMPSVATRRGDVQLPPSGLPIVLGADAPTTGGYPVIARVMDDDLAILGQLRPGERVEFRVEGGVRP